MGERMLIYIVRHAIAGNMDPEQWPDDTQRPLTKEGIRRFGKAARALRWLAPKVDVVLSSPSVRAWETAEILKKEAGWPEPTQCVPLQSAPPDAVLSAVHDYREAEAIALVGHEPFLSRLMGTLLVQNEAVAIELKKGAIACLRVGDVTNPLPGNAELLWLLPPRVLRAVASGGRKD
jgi:phosphohistidine phosphatase